MHLMNPLMQFLLFTVAYNRVRYDTRMFKQKTFSYYKQNSFLYSWSYYGLNIAIEIHENIILKYIKWSYCVDFIKLLRFDERRIVANLLYLWNITELKFCILTVQLYMKNNELHTLKNISLLNSVFLGHFERSAQLGYNNYFHNIKY